MSKKITLLVVSILVASQLPLTTSANRQSNNQIAGPMGPMIVQNLPRFVPGQVLVQFASSATESDRELYARAYGLQTIKQASEGVFLMELESNIWEAPLAALRLRRNGDIIQAEPNFIVRAACLEHEVTSQDLTSADYNGQWAVAAMNINEAKNQAKKAFKPGKPMIAHMDTGVAIGDLPPSVQAQLMDGYDAFADFPIPAAQSNDDNGHGTATFGAECLVSGTEIAPIKVLDFEGAGTEAEIIRAVDWVINLRNSTGRPITVNASWGTFDEPILLGQKIRECVNNHNIGWVAAAGNGNPGGDGALYLAAFPEVLSVGATDENGQLATLSNFGDMVDVAAPGMHVVSFTVTGYYGRFSGTSLAVPFTTGLLADVERKIKKATRGVSLIETSVNKEIPLPVKTGGRIDFLAALMQAAANQAAGQII